MSYKLTSVNCRVNKCPFSLSTKSWRRSSVVLKDITLTSRQKILALRAPVYMMTMTWWEMCHYKVNSHQMTVLRKVGIPGGWVGDLRMGCSLEMFKKYAKRYEDPVLWAWLEIFSPLRVKYIQGSYRSWKTWKVMESFISFSRPGKSWNLGLGHGKSWKISTLSMSERQ